MSVIFVDIALILALATILAAIFAKLHQPLVVAYLLVGIIAASSGILKGLTGGPTLDFFAELGIAFALFLIGLELRFSEIKQIGRAAVFLGVGQVIFTSLFGFLIATALGISSKEALYLAFALTLSSTIIVIKLLEQKRDLDSLYGKITIGYLIVQDFIAIAALIFLAGLGKGGEASDFIITATQGALLVGLILVLNRFVLQSLFDRLAKNTEVLFIASISWALVFAAVSVSLGFSIEIGAFLAGLGLASLREEQQIASWIRPLRNLFIILFFLSLGLKLSIATIFSIFGWVVLLSLFVLIGNPLIMMVFMGFLGFRRRTSFQVAVTSAQVSEFSLIFVALGGRLGLIEEKIINLTAAVALVTIVLSTYLIIHSSKIYRVLSPYLKIFERKNLTDKPLREEKEFSDHVVLVGAGRLGSNILKGLRRKGHEVIVVDFDPSVVKNLETAQISVIYGDISDPEIFEKALGKNPKMIISTVFDHEDTHFILKEVKNLRSAIPVVVTAAESQAALDFYRQGATYVIIPRLLSSHLVERYLLTSDFADLISGTLRKEHLEELKQTGVI